FDNQSSVTEGYPRYTLIYDGNYNDECLLLHIPRTIDARRLRLPRIRFRTVASPPSLIGPGHRILLGVLGPHHSSSSSSPSRRSRAAGGEPTRHVQIQNVVHKPRITRRQRVAARHGRAEMRREVGRRSAHSASAARAARRPRRENPAACGRGVDDDLGPDGCTRTRAAACLKQGKVNPACSVHRLRRPEDPGRRVHVAEPQRGRTSSNTAPCGRDAGWTDPTDGRARHASKLLIRRQ
ncbi:hypothetical protein DFH08DRAFT_356103, partial [Mycena albidolilacea]